MTFAHYGCTEADVVVQIRFHAQEQASSTGTALQPEFPHVQFLTIRVIQPINGLARVDQCLSGVLVLPSDDPTLPRASL